MVCVVHRRGCRASVAEGSRQLALQGLDAFRLFRNGIQQFALRDTRREAHSQRTQLHSQAYTHSYTHTHTHTHTRTDPYLHGFHLVCF